MIKTIELTAQELEFCTAYFAAVDFTETGDLHQPESGEEFCEVFQRESILDCLCFYSRISCYLNTEKHTIGQAGYDFWFTRNGHGTGFWDRKEIYGTAANHLTETAESFQCVEAAFENWCEGMESE